MTTKQYILWFSEIDKDDIPLVGGKGANLGEIKRAGFPVPDGFCVTAQAYFEFLSKADLRRSIQKILESLKINESRDLQTKAARIQQSILTAPIPSLIRDQIVSAYQELVQKSASSQVAIRSSATAEDLPEASFAGQQKSFMNVKGQDEVLINVQEAWASLFTARAIFYREQQGFEHLKVGLSAVVQTMVSSEVSGVLFTIDPISSNPNTILIEAGFGLGDAVVSGSITPDQYLVDKKKLKIIEKKIVPQTQMLGRNWGGNRLKNSMGKWDENTFWFPVSRFYQKKQKLSDEKIIELTKIGKKIEEHYQFPQDIEWAVSDHRLYILQTRPVTTIDIPQKGASAMSSFWNKAFSGVSDAKIDQGEKELPHPLLTGISASPGVSTGPVKIIHSSEELDKITRGDVLVTEMTNPDFVPGMKRAVAVVTDKGGKTSHAAIVSRELGVPCVVGTEVATKMLKTSEIVTVDGSEGRVYEGRVEGKEEKPGVRIEERQSNQAIFSPLTSSRRSILQPPNLTTKTATKLYVNLSEPEQAEKISQRNVDGVGLLRAEFMVSQIGQHPRYMLERGQREKFMNKLYEGVLAIVKAFDPRPVIYRTTDFKTNEYRGLKGGKEYEAEEENPMLGFRGVMRYLADEQVFKMELEALKKVRRYHKNLWVMLPFVRTVTELEEVKKIMSAVDLYRGGSLKILIMCEVPSTVFLLPKFIGVGIDGVSIGSNDLTQLLLGLDRDNLKVANLFDERDEAVLWAMKRVIKTCKQHGILSSICGQAPSIYPELVSELVKWGISSISVSPDAIEKTRQVILETEYDILRSAR